MMTNTELVDAEDFFFEISLTTAASERRVSQFF